ncbi:MAG: hypothetical protein LBD92_00055 [Oscillospiraceae bacterium]|nr:hypothetical protein [Oscillospiraceae bacterium]
MDKEAIGKIAKYLDGGAVGRIGEKMGDLDSLLNTADVQTVKEKIESSGVDLSAVIKNGDIDAVRGIFSDIAATSEGARIVKSLRDILGSA